MKPVCLIQTPCSEINDDRLEPPLGLMYISAYLKEHGVSSDILDLSGISSDRLQHMIPLDREIYGFSLYTVTYALTCELARYVKKANPQALIVAGGPHASALPENTLRDGYDVVVQGEGEQAMLDLVTKFKSRQLIPSIIRGRALDDLDTLPFPDYDGINVDSYTRTVNGGRSLSVLTSRGCPYSCAHCNSIIFREAGVRMRSADNVVREIQFLKKKYGIRHFRFQDDLFALNLRRVRELATVLKRENIEYRCFARVTSIDAEVAQLLKESGCVHVSLGVESADPYLLSESAMNKDQTPQDAQRALLCLREAGITSRVYLMIGFPGETDETVEATVRFMKGCPWDEFSVYPFIPYPGCRVFSNPERYGITYISEDYSRYLQVGKNRQTGFTFRTKEINEAKLEQWRNYVISELSAVSGKWAGDSELFR